MAKKKPQPVSEFKRLVALANELGSDQKTTIRKKTEEGTVTMTVQGACVTDGGAFVNQAAVNGSKFAYKANTGFGKADGSGGMSLDGTSATLVALEVMADKKIADGVGAEEPAEDTADDTALEKAGKPS